MSALQKITPCLWFDSNAEEAVNFYLSAFGNSRITGGLKYDEAGSQLTGKPAGSTLTVDFELQGYQFVALNGGPEFKFTPAISFFVVCETAAEVESLWARLAEGGFPLMPLARYDWSEKYGWVMDRFGLSWQISMGKTNDVGQSITPSLLFVGAQHGRAEEALRLYTATFPNSHVDGILRYTAGETEREGTVKHAQVALAGEKLMVMDNGMNHPFTFNEAISLMISCETQAEIDHYWSMLTANGGTESHCGWLKDPFGVSWQVVPRELQTMLQDPDRSRSQRVTQAYLGMRKFDLQALQQAYAGDRV